ncbi:MAG: tetratricopeptide repeat protein [Kofleriaceae bacterium]
MLGLIGQGGMGIVLAAYDPQLDRKVALKLLHPTADDSSSHARSQLMREARAMAKVTHPNVVTVFDVGEVGGRGFIAMQFVDGTTLRVWQTVRPRSWRELVAVYSAAGRGLEAAHAAGLTHRDFKPENVLMGSDTQPHVGDFGLVGTVAAAGDGSFAEASTERGWAGTPAYLSPEQWRGGVVDPRSDQFAFCAAMWEAIYGRLPFGDGPELELREAVLAGARQPPPRTDAPAWLERVLARGLDVDPDRRWPNMRSLLDELARRSRSRRWLAVAGVAAAGVVVTSVVALQAKEVDRCAAADSSMRATWSAERANGLRRALEAVATPYAAGVAASVVQRIDSYSGAWRAMAQETCRATEVRRVQSPELLDRRTACLESRRQELEALLTLLERKPDVATIDAAARATYGLSALDSCADIEGLLSQVPPPAPSERNEVTALVERYASARALHQLGRYADAAAAIDPVIRDARRIGYGPALADALHLAGSIRRDQDDLVGSVTMFEEAALVAARARVDGSVARSLLDLFEVVVDRQKKPERATALLPTVRAAVARAGERPVLRAGLAISEGLLADTASDYKAERDHMATAVAVFEEALGPSLELSMALNRYGNTLTELRQFDDARAALERSLRTLETIYGAGHPKVATLLNNLGWTAQEQGDWNAAADYHERALAIKERALGDHTSTATSLGNLGVVRIEQGRPEDALVLLERATAMAKTKAGPTHPSYALQLGNLAAAYSDLGRYADARVAHHAALAIKLATYGEAHASTAYTLENLAKLEARDSQLAVALGYAERAFAARQTVLGADHQMTGISVAFIAQLRAAQDRCDLALDGLERSITIIEKAVGATSIDLIDPLKSHAMCLVKLDRPKDALQRAERAAAIANVTAPAPAIRASVAVALGIARWAAAGTEPPAVRAQIIAAMKELREAGPPGARALAEATAWLARHPEKSR